MDFALFIFPTADIVKRVDPKTNKFFSKSMFPIFIPNVNQHIALLFAIIDKHFLSSGFFLENVTLLRKA